MPADEDVETFNTRLFSVLNSFALLCMINLLKNAESKNWLSYV